MADLVFWQRALSIHQAPLLSAVATRWPGQVHLVVASDQVPADRRSASGWGDVDYGSCQVHQWKCAPQFLEMPRATHVVSGLRLLGSLPFERNRIEQKKKLGSRIWLYTESWDPRGWKSVPRSIMFTLRARGIRRLLDGVLATGSLARHQFSFALDGVPFTEFGYYPAGGGMSAGPVVSDHVPRRLLFVGSLVELKGIRELVSAISMVPTVALDVIGAGPLEGELKELVRTQGIGDRVSFLGVKDNRDVARLMAAASALVLPSHYDGWGAVVNEALLAGLPVLVSAAPGAACLVNDDRGMVVSSVKAEVLAQALIAFQQRLDSGDFDRSAIRGWAQKQISPSAAAARLVQTLGRA